MKKFKTSMNFTKNFKHVYSTKYCELQFIFNRFEPIAYNAGIYGWNCDIYIDFKRDICITTGYRNTRGKDIPNKLITKYNAEFKRLRAAAFDASDPYKINAETTLRERFLDDLLTI